MTTQMWVRWLAARMRIELERLGYHLEDKQR